MEISLPSLKEACKNTLLMCTILKEKLSTDDWHAIPNKSAIVIPSMRTKGHVF